MVHLHITKLFRVLSVLSTISGDFFLNQKEKNLTGKKSLVADIIFRDSSGSGEKKQLGIWGFKPLDKKKNFQQIYNYFKKCCIFNKRHFGRIPQLRGIFLCMLR